MPLPKSSSSNMQTATGNVSASRAITPMCKVGHLLPSLAVQDAWLTTTLILDRMRAGDDAMWDTFVERFREPVLRLALRHGLDAAEAEDATQQVLATFLTGLRRDSYDRKKGRLSAWLFGIARHEIRRCAQHAQRRKRLGIAGSGDSMPSGLLEDPAPQDWEREWREHLLATAMGRVRRDVQPITWSAFERVQLHGESPAAVADALGMTKNAVFVAKHRVLTRLRQFESEIDDVRPIECKA